MGEKGMKGAPEKFILEIGRDSGTRKEGLGH